MRALPASETPTTPSKSGTSRCQPSGTPGRYSATSALTSASGCSPSHAAARAQRLEGRRQGRGRQQAVVVVVVRGAEMGDPAPRGVALVASLVQGQRGD